jgi:hypothetical protein
MKSKTKQNQSKKVIRRGPSQRKDPNQLSSTNILSIPISCLLHLLPSNLRRGSHQSPRLLLLSSQCWTIRPSALLLLSWLDAQSHLTRKSPAPLGDSAPSITTSQKKRRTLTVLLLDSSPTAVMVGCFTQFTLKTLTMKPLLEDLALCSPHTSSTPQTTPKLPEQKGWDLNVAPSLST